MRPRVWGLTLLLVEDWTVRNAALPTSGCDCSRWSPETAETNNMAIISPCTLLMCTVSVNNTLGLPLMRLLSAPHSPQASPQTIDHKMQQAGLRILKHNYSVPSDFQTQDSLLSLWQCLQKQFPLCKHWPDAGGLCQWPQSLDRVGYGECWCWPLGWGRQNLSVAVVGLNSPAPAPAGLWAPASSAPRRRVSLLYQWSPVEQSTPGG